MEPRGLMRVGVMTLIIGLTLGIIVPFAAFGGVFFPPWVVGVIVLPPLWAGVWTYLARRRTWWLVLLGQWMSLILACWLFFGSAAQWSVQAFLAGVVFGTLLLAVWMIPVGLFAAMPARR